VITSYFTDAVTVTTPAAVDRWGEPVGPPVTRTIDARVEYGARETRDQAGEVVVSSARILVNNEAGLTIDDRLTLEDGRVRNILSIHRHTDFSARYVEVHVA
jgi:hypothetical protein